VKKKNKAEFWKLVRARRKQPTLSLGQLKGRESELATAGGVERDPGGAEGVYSRVIGAATAKNA
jgi:hypothetical protein